MLLEGLKVGKTEKVVESYAELEKLFDQLIVGVKPLERTTYKGPLMEHADGTRVGLRPTSMSGGATIDVHYPNGSGLKVHIEGGGP